MAPPSQDDPTIVDSTAALASLYQAPLGEFVSRRAALVAQLKRSGHKEVATRIASAGKPSRAAFLVNQVFWRNRPVYDAVLGAGTAARTAQQARLLGETGVDLTETLRARDEAVRMAVEEAQRIAEADGQPPSEAILGQVRASFEAVAAHGLEGRLPHGHLTADVELPGLAALAGLMLPATPGPVRKFEVVARRAPEAPVAPAEEPPPDPRVLELERLLGDLRGREQAAAARVEELERGLSSAGEALVAAEAAAAAATRQLEAAREAVRKGEQAREAAQRDRDLVARERAAAERRLQRLQAPDADPDSPGTPSPGRPPARSRKKPSKATHPASGPRRPRE